MDTLAGISQTGSQLSRNLERGDPRFTQVILHFQIVGNTVYKASHNHLPAWLWFRHRYVASGRWSPSSFEKSSNSVIVLYGFSGYCGRVKQNSKLHTAFLVWAIQHNSVSSWHLKAQRGNVIFHYPRTLCNEVWSEFLCCLLWIWKWYESLGQGHCWSEFNVICSQNVSAGKTIQFDSKLEFLRGKTNKQTIVVLSSWFIRL